MRDLADHSLDEGSPSVEIQQSQYSTSTCRRQHTPTWSASSSNLETCTLIGDRYVARRRPRDTCLLEMGSSSRRLSLHRHQVHGWTSVNTNLEKGSVNIEATETGMAYIYRSGQEEVRQPRPVRLQQPGERLGTPTPRPWRQVSPLDRSRQRREVQP